MSSSIAMSQIQANGTRPTASQFAVSSPATATIGQPVPIPVTAEDSSGNRVSGYGGTGTCNVTFDTAGTQSVTTTDPTNSTITGSSPA
jgi:hypothetical protein